MIVEELNNSENKCCSTSLLSNDSETSLIPSANEFNDTTEHKFIKSRWFRYIVAILIIFLPIGVFCCFDAPSAMAKEMANYPPGVDASKIMFLMSFYSLPNIVFAFIGGFVVDSVLGLRNGAITFAITVFVGYTIEIIGVFSNQLWLMCVGRLIFGLGGESLQSIWRS
ncbi:hypothetical protein A3Q56_08047 [Intoshia linei]|uniref:Major facilitator superfamily (MFS) profile domain-containing protein n=1 Tax=Intoshia linei TaxID=1819745 RepID=A0A177AQE9_9BILA|nr:hypothetical protein A3Q56_08047 [Intoshia linei]